MPWPFNRFEFGIVTESERPLGFSASLLVGEAAIEGLKGTLLQPIGGAEATVAFSTTEPIGVFHGSTLRGNSSAEPQETGWRRKAVSERPPGRSQGPDGSSTW